MSRETSKAINWNELFERLFFLYQAETQEALAKRLSVSQDLISKWKRQKARPTWELIERVCSDHDVSWEWLLTGRSSDLGELISIYSMIRESDVVDSLPIKTAQMGLYGIAVGRYHEILGTHSGDFFEKNFESVNRMFFAGTHVTPFCGKNDFKSMGDMVNFYGRDDTLDALKKCGYTKLYDFTKNALESIFNSLVIIKYPLKTEDEMDLLDDDENICVEDKTPPTKASGAREMDSELIEAVFLAQEALVHLGKSLAVGQSEDDVRKLVVARDAFRKLLEQLESSIRTHEIHDRTA